MYRLNITIILLLLVCVGCGNKSKPQVAAPLIPKNVPSNDRLDLSEALPSFKSDESFSSLTKNDLIDGFYYFYKPQSMEPSNSTSLRIRLAVLGNKACYLATGLGGSDFEIESLMRESPGIWRGTHSGRYFTQPTFNSLVIYRDNNDKEASYENSLVRSDDLRLIAAEFKRRNPLVGNIARLTLQNDVEAVYQNACLGFQPIYFRGKLSSFDKEKEIEKIEDKLTNFSLKP